MISYPDWFMTLMGVIAPWVVQIIKRHVPKRTPRFVVAVVLCALWGVIGAALSGKLSGDLPTWLTWTFVFAQLSYNLFWKSLFDGILPNLRE